ncbi:uncharacterized protein STAUR_5694 [Stigmatella aurantiaca DW4/3-1]|uniref:Uncharacterized protein n=1 Tax=Stigmatella aurantiaca (strain DW4/3-1) TaxID=378806 RepID=E3FUD8_STIAD|nr:uncharacterized protein STAUR_5694 [Stigmatella aurantiaca DW4/3-1]
MARSVKEERPLPLHCGSTSPPESFHMPAQKGNRSKKKLSNRAKVRKGALKRRRVRAKRGQNNKPKR